MNLRNKGIRATLINMHTIKPLDKKAVLEMASKHDFIFSVEEHNLHGGMGSLISDVLLESGYKGHFFKIGIPPKLDDVIGDVDYLRHHYGLDPNGIAKRIIAEMKK